MMSILPTWPLAAGALAIGLVLGIGGTATVKNAKIDRMEADYAKALVKAAANRVAVGEVARNTEQEMVESLTRTLQEKENEKARIALERDVALASLRERPERRVVAPGPAAPTASDCKGSTGAELSRTDAEFLVGLAARADGIAAALGQCYAQYDSARALMDQYASQVSANDTAARPQNAANR